LHPLKLLRSTKSLITDSAGMSAYETITDPNVVSTQRSSLSSALATLRDWLATTAGADRAHALAPTADSQELLVHEAVAGSNLIGDVQDGTSGSSMGFPIAHHWLPSADDSAAVTAQMETDLASAKLGGAVMPVEAAMPSRPEDAGAAERSVMIDATGDTPVDGNETGSAFETAGLAAVSDRAPITGEPERTIDLQQLLAGRAVESDDTVSGNAVHHDGGSAKGGEGGGDLAETAEESDTDLNTAATAVADLVPVPDFRAEADAIHLSETLNEHFGSADLVADQPAPDDGAPVPEQPQTVIPSSGAYFIDVVALARYGVSNADMVHAVFAGQEHQLHY
jgi:hypothetical protein